MDSLASLVSLVSQGQNLKHVMDNSWASGGGRGKFGKMEELIIELYMHCDVAGNASENIPYKVIRDGRTLPCLGN